MPFDSANPGRPLIIVGASTRAAAHSALRGGFAPLCVDLFGDVDLRSVARVVTVAHFGAQTAAAIAELPAVPWMYTGALENHPRLIGRLSRERAESAKQSSAALALARDPVVSPLLGNGPEALARVRDPWWLADTLRAAGLPALDVWPRATAPPSPDGRWMRKLVRGGGGRGIRAWDGRADAAHAGCYFQRCAVGEHCSAQFLALPTRTILVGVTRQLIGLREVGAPPFAWCGAIAPASFQPPVGETMHGIGTRIAVAGGLRGLFGCDFVVAAGVPWLTEVNPRYTAAMELLDYLLGASLVAWHVQACGGSEPENPRLLSQISNLKSDISIVGKIVLFAESDVAIGDATALLSDPRDDRLPLVADLPAPGSRIPAGFPICTLFASANTGEACVANLIESATEFRRRYLQPCGPIA